MKKKIFTFLFAIMAGMTSLNAETIFRVKIGDIYYNLSTDSRTAEVAEGGAPYPSTVVTIPSSVEYESNVYSVTSIGVSAFSDTGWTGIIIPNSVTSIGDYAFHKCHNLQSITIPNSVTNIGKCAFQLCQKLESITLPNNIEILEEWVFSSCSCLVSITIPNSVKRIKREAFYSCTSLTSITIPDNVTSIGSSAFNSCSSLASVTLSHGITEIDMGAFQDCSSLTSITIPNSVTSIGEYAFSGCSELTNVVLPTGITTIEEGVFSDCPKMVSITIPSSVTKVKGWILAGNTSLTEIRNYGETPANAFSSAFDDVDKSSCKLYVPKNSINLYKSAPVWKEFYLISAIEDVQAIEDAEVDNVRSAKVIIDGKVYINRGDKVFTLQGQEVK